MNLCTQLYALSMQLQIKKKSIHAFNYIQVYNYDAFGGYGETIAVFVILYLGLEPEEEGGIKQTLV